MTRIVKKPEERRAEIILAAKEIFMAKDYDRTTMQDVMQKLSIAKGTIYHYFKSKEDLLEAVIQHIVDTYINDIQQTLDNSKGTALDQFRTLIKAGQIADREKETIDSLHRPGNVALHSRLLALAVSRLAKLYAEVSAQGCKEGVFATEHPLESAELLLAGIQFLTDEGCYPWSKTDLKRRMDAIPVLFEAQLKAKKGTFDFLRERST